LILRTFLTTKGTTEIHLCHWRNTWKKG